MSFRQPCSAHNECGVWQSSVALYERSQHEHSQVFFGESTLCARPCNASSSDAHCDVTPALPAGYRSVRTWRCARFGLIDAQHSNSTRRRQCASHSHHHSSVWPQTFTYRPRRSRGPIATRPPFGTSRALPALPLLTPRQRRETGRQARYGRICPHWKIT